MIKNLDAFLLLLLSLLLFAPALAAAQGSAQNNRAETSDQFVELALEHHRYFMDAIAYANDRLQQQELLAYNEDALNAHREMRQALKAAAPYVPLLRNEETHRFMDKLKDTPDTRFAYTFIDQQHDAYSNLVALYGRYQQQDGPEALKQHAQNWYPELVQLWDRTKELQNHLRGVLKVQPDKS